MSDPLEWDDPPLFNALPAVDNLPLASFPYPVQAPDVEPDDCGGGDTICVEYRKEWQPLIAGALRQLAQPSTWAGTKAEQITALNRVSILIDMLCGEASGVGNCGCSDPITNRRYNDAGVLEVSRDYGLTWTPTTAGDARVTGAIFPPLSGADGDTKRCKAADNIVTHFTELMDQSADEMDATGDLAELAVVIAGTAAIFTGVFSPFGLALIAFAAEGLEFGADAVRAAFDGDVWARFRCNLYCHMNDDGTISQPQLDAIWAQLGVDETGAALVLIRKAIAFYGVVGMTNQGRLGSGTGADCGDCDCECLTEEIYTAQDTGWVGGLATTDGSCGAGRYIGGGFAPAVFTIPNRGGRLVSGVIFPVCDGTGGGVDLSMTAKIGGVECIESPVSVAAGNYSFTLASAADTDEIEFDMVNPAYSVFFNHITVLYEC